MELPFPVLLVRAGVPRWVLYLVGAVALLITVFFVVGRELRGVGFVAVTVPFLLRLSKKPEPVRGKLIITPADVTFQTTRVARRADLTAALVVGEEPPRVELWAPRHRLAVLGVEDIAHAREVARVLGFAGGARLTRVEVSASWGTKLTVLAGAAACLGVAGVPLALGHMALGVACVGVAALGIMALRRWQARTLEVGVDGLRLSGARADRLVGYSAISEVSVGTRWPANLEVACTSGPRLELPTADPAVAEGLAALVRSLMSRPARAAPEAVERLARGDRAPAAWLEELRRLGAGADSDHRTAPLTADQLWATVTGPDSRGIDRAAAAVALAAVPERRKRLRAVAQGIAAPRVRNAVEATARGATDEEALEALGALDGQVD